MSFHDVPQEVVEERIERMRREADAYRRASQARRGRRPRARRRWSLRRQAAAIRLSTLARTANELIGAIISPPWPTRDETPRYARPGSMR
jgi:hypothetical protein